MTVGKKKVKFWWLHQKLWNKFEGGNFFNNYYLYCFMNYFVPKTLNAT